MAAKKTTTKTTKTETPAPAAKKTAKKAPAAKKAAAAEKAPTKKEAKTAAVKPAASPKPAPSPDAIARAAYLNYRHRVENGLPGDSHTDWLEAVRQLTA